jgi:hypothetical protein
VDLVVTRANTQWENELDIRQEFSKGKNVVAVTIKEVFRAVRAYRNTAQLNLRVLIQVIGLPTNKTKPSYRQN